jgi:hypothetical protein
MRLKEMEEQSCLKLDEKSQTAFLQATRLSPTDLKTRGFPPPSYGGFGFFNKSYGRHDMDFNAIGRLLIFVERKIAER